MFTEFWITVLGPPIEGFEFVRELASLVLILSALAALLGFVRGLIGSASR